MKSILLILLVGCIFSYQRALPQERPVKLESQERSKQKKMIIEFQLGANMIKGDSLDLDFSPVNVLCFMEDHFAKVKLSNGYAKWRIPLDTPVWFHTTFLKHLNKTWLAEPGDSIVIKADKKGILLAGKGAEKYELLSKIDSLKRTVPKPSNLREHDNLTLKEYLEWSSYLNKQLDILLPVIESYRSKLSSFSFNWIKAETIALIEDVRYNKFLWFRDIAERSGVTKQDLCNIFDSTFYGEAARWMRAQPIGLGISSFIKLEAQRRAGFDLKPAVDKKRKAELVAKRYEYGKEIYTGLTRERFLTGLMTYDLIKKVGFTPEAEAILTKYYTEPGDPRYKKYVREYERKARTLIAGERAPDFSLTDMKGEPFASDKIKGKIALIDFWFTGCRGCIQMAPVMKTVEEKFKGDSNILFLSVSTDEDRAMWTKSVVERKYTSGNGINLYTNGEGTDHYMIKAYNISSYPTLYLLDADGTIIQHPVPDPRNDDGKQLISLIGNKREQLHDGPYIFYNGDTVNAYSVYGNEVSKKLFDRKDKPTFSVATDEANKHFSVQLKEKLEVEPSVYDKPEKLFVLSDIEGNFDVLRKLLQSNKVIDENYNWTFGKGHLVLNGDMFDRGKQVTECLWLIYSLEEKAKAAGGYAHFVLGNHEIMNLSGDHHYNVEKYQSNVQRLGVSHAELYGKSTELGRWLRTKNIMEKIGDLLFVHAGVSKEIADLPLSIQQMNELARPYLDKDSIAEASPNKNLALLFDTRKKHSPFWYRLYYLDQDMKIMLGRKGVDTLYKTPAAVVDYVLEKMGVSRIITGHTMVGKRNMITAHYDGKVINTDTWHEYGKSEALLIEENKYYRVTIEGRRQPLFNSSYAIK